MTSEATKAQIGFNPLDMNNYKIEKLPKMQKSGFERWMAILGGPLAVLLFVLINWVLDIGFLKTQAEQSMLAIFVAGLVLWMTEAIPNYLTSLVITLAIVLTGVTSQKVAFAQLGHPVMWLNILSFVLASMLVKTRAAKRFALWFVLKFGRSAGGVFFSFIVINLVLSAFISATTAKATILLPIFMVVAAIYGAADGKRNNFGRNLVLQNLFQINVGATGFLTGSGAHLLAISLFMGAYGSGIGYSEWFVACFPLTVIMIIIGWYVGTKVIFPMTPEERTPQIEGGMEHLRSELESMGKMTVEEYKAIAIFVGVLLMWSTDKLHGLDATTVAFIGAVIALLPKIGVVKWNDVDIPWHLMLFSAGAYTLGVGLDETDLPATVVNHYFDGMGIGTDTPFWVLYLILTFMMMFSGLIFQSKTMRTLIFVPIAIGVEQRFGLPMLSLAFPVAMLIEHVYVLPFNSKPAALLYNTNQYSWSDTFKFGIVMMVISWILIILWGDTVLRWMGYTPGVFF